MCGIVGFLRHSGEAAADAELVKTMTMALAHRGPDDEGIFHDDPVTLGQRRLAIIDLSPAGHQPMSTPDGRFTLVFNGEIYNYRELAEQYCRHIPLRSKTDTEVLLHMLAQLGGQALPRLRGMFALALWDQQTETMLLARDPWGKKPLYYVQTAEGFLFASEIKALLTHPALVAQLDVLATTQYLLHEYAPAPATGFTGIAQLLPGHLARAQKNTFTTRAWWQPSFGPKHTDNEKTILQKFDELLTQAVERRLIADVPVGLFLSGGLDSTTIGWYMKKLQSRPFHSFSVGFPADTYNESSWARAAAVALGTVHHAITFDEQAFAHFVKVAATSLDIPFGDSSFLPTLAVSQAAAERVTVVLDGDGSDELLGGYGTFMAERAAAWLPRWPRVWRSLTEIGQRMPTRHSYFSLDFKIKSFLRGVPYSSARRQQVWLGSFLDTELRQLLRPPYQAGIAQVFEPTERNRARWKELSTVDQHSARYLSGYLPDDILVKLDRATMHASIEARTPFLDVDLAEFLLRLPVRYKRNKYALRRLMRGRIPDSIIDRPKQGFALPLGQWLAGPLYPWAKQVLAPERLAQHGLFNEPYVEQLLREHRRGAADHRKKLWTLIAWQLWYDHWLA